MAETLVQDNIGNESVRLVSGEVNTKPGSVGIQSQVPGHAATVTNAASATGGIDAGNFVERDIDDELFQFESDDTPLMQLMLKAKRVNVSSPEVEHYMIDEPRTSVVTIQAIASAAMQAVLPLGTNDQEIPRAYTNLLVPSIDGYDETGQNTTPGKPLMLFVTGQDPTSNCPIVRAVNGSKTLPTDEYSNVPAIPAGTKCIILGNSLYETQKNVEPDLIVPRPSLIYCQKRGMNQVVSDYFDAQKKRIPFTKAIIAEQAIRNFKCRGNRTLWAGRKGKFKVNTKIGMQYVWTTEGIRWQFKRELQHTGKWTVEKIIALAKMFFTGEDVPKTALLLAGKNLLEEIQCIDFSKHPEVQITTKTNPIGWVVTNFHTVFGDIEIKREPALDRLGWSNSGALIGENRLVHYRYTTEHSFNEDVEGEEAKRSGMLVWDALALKGSCHVWIDGETSAVSAGTGAARFIMWDDDTKPTGDDLVNGAVYYLLQDCQLDANTDGQSGQMWQATVSGNTTTWSEYKGEVYA